MTPGKADTSSSTYVSTLTMADGTVYGYSYDSIGNITRVTENGVLKLSYQYDGLGQLVREDNAYANATYAFTYDGYGNILSKSTYGYTLPDVDLPTSAVSTNTYSYGNENWPDQLTEYNGTDITYDAIGNPLNYYNGENYAFTWEGRQLVGATDGTNTYAYTYNSNGIRVEKVANSVVHKYTIDETKILAETYGDTTLHFYYDENDSPIAFSVNGTMYYYGKNLQGDVVRLYTASGEVVAEYAYDALGKLLAITDANGATITDTTKPALINPIKYRGYYYDSEIGLYYVSSRYYDPEIGRWISPEPNVYNGEFDEGAKLLGYNVYVYCANNPINFLDDTGESITAILIGIGISALVGALAGWGYAKYFKIPKNKTWKYVLGGALIGAAIGGCIGYAVGGSAGSGAVLWSGKSQGMDAIAKAFAKKNGLKVLESTMRGRLLNALSKKLSWKVMEPLWKSASTRFLLKYAGKQTYVHVFISASAYGNMQSVFNTVELQVIAELGMKIIWHYYK